MCPYILPGASWVLHGPCYLPTAPLKPDLNYTHLISAETFTMTLKSYEQKAYHCSCAVAQDNGHDQVTRWRHRIAAELWCPLQLSKYPRVTLVTQSSRKSYAFETTFQVNNCWGLITVDKSQHDDRAAIQMPGWRIGTWWPPRPVMCAPSVTAPTWLARINHTVSGLCAHWGSGTADLCTTISQDQWPLAMELADHQYSYRAGEGCDCDVTTNQWSLLTRISLHATGLGLLSVFLSWRAGSDVSHVKVLLRKYPLLQFCIVV